MTLVEDDLWSDVLRRPTERPRLLTDSDLLGKTKVHLEKTSGLNTFPHVHNLCMTATHRGRSEDDAGDIFNCVLLVVVI